MTRRASAHLDGAEPAQYSPLTPKAAIQLMAPPTWAAAIVPVFVGGALTIGLGVFTPQTVSLRAIAVMALMLLTAILAQSAVNTLNDYEDFVKGTDTQENCVDETDASIIYHKLDPKSARNVAIACMAGAGVSGLVVVALSGWLSLVIGGIGAVVVVLYSAGPKPISYLPLGEFVSGLVMGTLITFATYYAMTLEMNWWVLLYSFPAFVTIGLIMQTNNTCDIERDVEAGRRTLPMIIGGMRASAHMIAVANVAVIVFMAVVCGLLFPVGLVFVALAIVVSWRNIKTLYTLDYSSQTRPRAMGTSVKQTLILNACYVLAILIGAHFNA